MIEFGFGAFAGAYRQRRLWSGEPPSDTVRYGSTKNAGFYYAREEYTHSWGIDVFTGYTTHRVHADPDTSGLDPEDLRKITEGWTTEPAAADASEFLLRVELERSITVPLLAGVKEADYSGTSDSTLFAFCGGSGFFSDPLAAGDTEMTWTATRTQAKNIALYGIKISPPTIFNDGTATMPSYSQIADARMEVDWKNPAARGTASAFAPAAYSAIVNNAATTVTFAYSHKLGGYSAGLLSVTATSLDTGEQVEICRKAAVSIADGGTGSFTIPANTLSEGTWELTVCVCPAASENYYGDTDAFWTSGEKVWYNVRENPSAGRVSCDGTPIPIVYWTSENQSAYQVRFADYDSGIREGTDRELVVPQIFPDGAYPVQVRTGNASGKWSDWTEPYYATIANDTADPEALLKIRLTAEQVPEGILLKWDHLGGQYILWAVYRDGKLIGTTAANNRQFLDKNGGGAYQIYGIMPGRYYRTSMVREFLLDLPGDRISADGGVSWISLKYTPQRKSMPESRRREVSYYYYAGREKPVAVDAGQTERTISCAYIFKNRAAARAVEALVGREVILQTTRGDRIRGVIAEMSRTEEGRLPVTLTFTIRETDEEEYEYPI